MLAPRKTLWSTPLGAIDHLQTWISLQGGDKICDIGCGDGRILLEWAKRLSSPTILENELQKGEQGCVPPPEVSMVGIDIDPERIQECQRALTEARMAGLIHSNIRVNFVCANALDLGKGVEATTVRDCYQNANVFFLYLIPRGLKLIHAQVLDPLRKIKASRSSSVTNRPLRVVSYMAKLPGESVTDRALLTVEHQPGAEWPLYYYELPS